MRIRKQESYCEAWFSLQLWKSLLECAGCGGGVDPIGGEGQRWRVGRRGWWKRSRGDRRGERRGEDSHMLKLVVDFYKKWLITINNLCSYVSYVLSNNPNLTFQMLPLTVCSLESRPKMQQLFESGLSETGAGRGASESSLDFLSSFDENLDIMCFALGGDKDPS